LPALMRRRESSVVPSAETLPLTTTASAVPAAGEAAPIQSTKLKPLGVWPMILAGALTPVGPPSCT